MTINQNTEVSILEQLSQGAAIFAYAFLLYLFCSILFIVSFLFLFGHSSLALVSLDDILFSPLASVVDFVLSSNFSESNNLSLYLGLFFLSLYLVARLFLHYAPQYSRYGTVFLYFSVLLFFVSIFYSVLNSPYPDLSLNNIDLLKNIPKSSAAMKDFSPKIAQFDSKVLYFYQYLTSIVVIGLIPFMLITPYIGRAIFSAFISIFVLLFCSMSIALGLWSGIATAFSFARQEITFTDGKCVRGNIIKLVQNGVLFVEKNTFVSAPSSLSLDGRILRGNTGQFMLSGGLEEKWSYFPSESIKRMGPYIAPLFLEDTESTPATSEKISPSSSMYIRGTTISCEMSSVLFGTSIFCPSKISLMELTQDGRLRALWVDPGDPRARISMSVFELSEWSTFQSHGDAKIEIEGGPNPSPVGGSPPENVRSVPGGGAGNVIVRKRAQPANPPLCNP